MLGEIMGISFFAGLYGVAKLKQDGSSNDDAKKIISIADNLGLTKEGKSIRIYRKTLSNPKKGRKYAEYVYKIPLGLSLKDFEKNLHAFEDGLNNKKTMYFVSLKDLKNIPWKELNTCKTLKGKFEKIKRTIGEKYEIRKSIELSYDGMLRFKVHEQGIPNYIDFREELWSNCKGFEMPLGEDRDGVVFIDLGEGHFVVAGATTYGKSQFIKLLISTLLHNNPTHTELSLIDLKGGLEMMYFEDCKQTMNFADDLSGAVEVLKSIKEEIEARQRMLKLKRFNNVRKAGIKTRHFVIIDEASQLSPDMYAITAEKDLAKECQSLMGFITRIGHSMGYTLVFATQYPTADILPRQVKANSTSTICFRLETDTQSEVVLDKAGAELIQYRGRCIFKRPSGMRQIQTFLISDEQIDKAVTPNIIIRPRKDEIQHEQTPTEEGSQDRFDSELFEDSEIHD